MKTEQEIRQQIAELEEKDHSYKRSGKIEALEWVLDE